MTLKQALNVPNVGNPNAIVELAMQAEEAGWDGFFVWDTLQTDASQRVDVLDPASLLSAIAVSTSRIALGPMVIALPRRRPWKVAKEIITIDHLARGRVIAGFGLGAPPKEEFADFGEPTDLRARAELLDEGLGIIDAMFAGETLDHAGPAYTVRAHLSPRGYQHPRPPIWVASIGTNRGPLARARRWDGVFTLTKDFQGLTPADVHAWRDRIDRDDNYVITTTARAGIRSRDLEVAGLNWRVSEPPRLHNDWISDLRPLVLAGPDASDF
ncbi:LLM class flavin-dependent oxidoreductase [Mycolicibacterium sp. YH-1]|uniref:LLM class flavin-dependent oxidoreductase n=1 Tax=Mycolicibacterium sp. YH-1 TaxID=2908837 RepID=UPI001F4C1EF5|nr:LLM class flavin-dependent oxidoreductase [Mycolicibacterium sp. YH-1]UNB52574.1 LLM class flavin-dependent oxidoreductase [Mycolicibacterium sp. YH-1]